MFTFRGFTFLFFILLLTLNLTVLFSDQEVRDVVVPEAARMYSVLIAGYLGISVAMAFLPCSGFHHPVTCTGSGHEAEVALTFHDGPDPSCTPQILEILERNSIRAAFFCTGIKLKENPELAARIHSLGHLIGNHSYSHSPWFDLFPARRMQRELADTNAQIRSLTGLNPRFFRPPFGVVNPMVNKALRKTTMLAVCWSIRSFDTLGHEPASTLERITRRLRPGSIILLHDHSRFSAEKLQELITEIRKSGYTIVPLDHLLNTQAYEA